METIRHDLIAELYAGFEAAITVLDCGDKCAPYNEHGVPYCCDTRHLVPTAYDSEWIFLQENTDLWHVWQAETQAETQELRQATPDKQVLIECKGHRHCQRNFRSFTCRAFPFFPYLNSKSEFIGLSYYAEYAEFCWVISHLQRVEQVYLDQFFHTYERIFALDPKEKVNFSAHSAHVREVFARKRRHILLITRKGDFRKIHPLHETEKNISSASLPKFGLYRIAEMLPFPGEEID